MEKRFRGWNARNVVMTGEADWWPLAECLGSDTNAFFPHAESVPFEVAAICSRCRVREECLSYAMADPEVKGIWAATSTRDRNRLRRGHPEPDSDGIVWETG